MDLDLTQMQFVVDWAAMECARQRSGEFSVGNMVRGWAFALVASTGYYPGEVVSPTEDDILLLGTLVEPLIASSGYRRHDLPESSDVEWLEVPDRTIELVGLLGGASMLADEWYREFERIHPFAGGNARVGSILFNWLNGSLLLPVTAPANLARPRSVR